MLIKLEDFLNEFFLLDEFYIVIICVKVVCFFLEIFFLCYNMVYVCDFCIQKVDVIVSGILSLMLVGIIQ